MAWTRIDFDTATIDGDTLVVTGTAPATRHVRLVPRQYRSMPPWADVDVVVAAAGPGAAGESSSASTESYSVTCGVTGITGSAGIRVVGQTKLVSIPFPPAPASPRAGGSADASGADPSFTTARPAVAATTGQAAPSRATGGGVMVTTTVVASAASAEVVDAARRLAAEVFGADPACRDRWVSAGRDSLSVVALWDDEVAYRRCAVSNGYYDALESLAAAAGADPAVEVAALVG